MCKDKNCYLLELRNLILNLLKEEPVKVVVFGSRGRGDSHNRSDVGI